MADIEVRAVEGKGRGVFALRHFRAGELVERAPVIVIPAEQGDMIAQTVLDNYWYDWRKDVGDAAIVLGFGLIYNHSYHPNVKYVRRFEALEMDYIAIRDIARGEEIRMNYNGAVEDQTEVWFDVIP